MKMLKLGIIAVTTALLAGCVEESTPNTRQEGAKEQENVMQTARNAFPIYQPTNFLTRKAINKWMERMDVPDKTFYIYLIADNGTHIGYYVGQTRPICSSLLLTPPDQVNYWRGASSSSTTAVSSAPSLDGVYSGGDCSTYFFFDATTDAVLEIQGIDFISVDQPLSIDADPITVTVQ